MGGLPAGAAIFSIASAIAERGEDIGLVITDFLELKFNTLEYYINAKTVPASIFYTGLNSDTYSEISAYFEIGGVENFISWIDSIINSELIISNIPPGAPGASGIYANNERDIQLLTGYLSTLSSDVKIFLVPSYLGRVLISICTK